MMHELNYFQDKNKLVRECGVRSSGSVQYISGSLQSDFLRHWPETKWYIWEPRIYFFRPSCASKCGRKFVTKSSGFAGNFFGFSSELFWRGLSHFAFTPSNVSNNILVMTPIKILLTAYRRILVSFTLRSYYNCFLRKSIHNKYIFLLLLNVFSNRNNKKLIILGVCKFLKGKWSVEKN